MTQMVGSKAAWGLEIGANAARLVRVAANESGGVSIEHRGPTFDVTEFWRSGVLDAELVEALKGIFADEPLGVCFPDQMMLCRGFSVPAASRELLEKMVQAQVDGFLSTGQDRLAWTWRDQPDPVNEQMRWIVFCAVRKDLLEKLNRAMPAGLNVKTLLPRMIAATEMTTPSTAQEASELLMEITDDSATLGLFMQGRLLRCSVIERDGDAGGESDSNIWLRQSRQSFQSLVEGLPAERWPKHGVIRSSNGQAAKVSPHASQVLGMPFKISADVADSDSVAAPACAGAIGAARILLEGTSANTINFARKREVTAPIVALNRKRIVRFAAACLAGVFVLYCIDCYRAWWLNRQVEQVRVAEAASGGIEKRLAIDHYLEREASAALPGLDAFLSAAPQSLSMTTFGLNSSGQFHFVGRVAPGELNDFLRKLQESRVLTGVELRSGHAEQQSWQIDLSANAAPMAGLIIVNQPKAAKPAATQPAKGGPPR